MPASALAVVGIKPAAVAELAEVADIADVAELAEGAEPAVDPGLSLVDRVSSSSEA
jgi:hypothetical protein